MKIAVSSTGRDPTSDVEAHFGRCPGFLVVDSKVGDYQFIENNALGSAHGAGIQTAQYLASMGVKVVIAGNVGPNAYSALTAAGVEVYTGVTGSVANAVHMYREGKLAKVSGPTVGGHYGGGGGRSGKGRR